MFTAGVGGGGVQRIFIKGAKFFNCGLLEGKLSTDIVFVFRYP